MSALEPWLDLGRSLIRYKPNDINLNGIVVSADGRYLLSIQFATGPLWRIDTQSKGVMQVRVEGGDLTQGDGLMLSAPNELYVMRNANDELVGVRLGPDWAAGASASRSQTRACVISPRLRPRRRASWS